jgi:hypothetical protein
MSGRQFQFAWRTAALVRCTRSMPTQRTAHTENHGQTIVIVLVRRSETGFSVWLTRQISAQRRRAGGYKQSRQGAWCLLRILSQKPTWQTSLESPLGSKGDNLETRRPAMETPCQARGSTSWQWILRFAHDDSLFVGYFCATNCLARLSSGRAEFEPSQTFSNSA